MTGKLAPARAMSVVFLLIFSLPAIGWGSPGPLAGPGLLKNSPGQREMADFSRGPRSSLIIDAQQGRHGEIEAGLHMHYNRVDGFFFQLGVDSKLSPPTKLRFFAWGGYAFEGKAWRYEIGLEKWLNLGPNRLEVGIRYYDLTFTEDEWLMPTNENSLAAFSFREDFHDYYRRTGTCFHLTNTLYKRLTLEIAYLLDEHESLARTTNWSLFGGGKKFRENPPSDDGPVQSLVARIGYDTRDDFIEPYSGFLVEATYENGGGKFGGDYDFDRFLLDARRYLRLTRYENIDLRFRLGTASGALPVQLAFDLGGIGSLRGYKHKEFRDFDRMILCNVEYRIQFGRMASNYPQDCQIIPFYDFGLAWHSNDKNSLTAGFDQLKADRIKSSVGIGLSSGADDRLRVNLTQRLDDRGRSMVVSARIHRIF
ncbi:BamA/TamA family outer membrane protein [bacterium]|nr:BamA/TamA family outer membrane protein [bacterium]